MAAGCQPGYTDYLYFKIWLDLVVEVAGIIQGIRGVVYGVNGSRRLPENTDCSV